MIIAQITDAHMTLPGRAAVRRTTTRRTRCGARSRRCEAQSPRPDVVLFTGDVTENGLPGQYAAARAILDGFELPLAVIPGNHDRRETFAAAFAGAPRAGRGRRRSCTSPSRTWPLRLIGLDTLVGARRNRAACCARRGSTGSRPGSPRRPSATRVIFMHHPPFATGIGFMDSIACENGDRLAELVAAHGRVLRVICGHVHRPVTVGFGGTVASICPGIAYQVPLRFARTAPVEMLYQEPAFQLHVWTPETGLVTHTDYLRDRA